MWYSVSRKTIRDLGAGMTPTDAQIEAATRIANLYNEGLRDCTVSVASELARGAALEWAKAALTAAAEVRDKNTPTCPTCGASEPDWNAAAAFDAQSATIERCARVLDELAAEPSQPAIKASAYEAGAAAIRALKDKPDAPA